MKSTQPTHTNTADPVAYSQSAYVCDGPYGFIVRRQNTVCVIGSDSNEFLVCVWLHMMDGHVSDRRLQWLCVLMFH